jgi:hypothetical protein
LSFDNPIVCDHHGADWTEEDRVARHEGEEAGSMGEDFPWTYGPTTDDGTNYLATADIDILRNDRKALSAKPCSSNRGKAQRIKETFGAKAVKSFAALMLFPLMLVPSVARANAKLAKNDAGRLSHRSMSRIGSHIYSP